MLSHLAGKDVFQEVSRGRFALNDARGSDGAGRAPRAAVRTGAPAYHEIFGWSVDGSAGSTSFASWRAARG
jgi:hypothetical protein